VKPIHAVPAWAVVDTDGRVCWGLVFQNKREASWVARHPERRIVRLEVAGVVLVLVYVLREPNEVRAISLRRASKQERRLYADHQETH
jgi:uncharacterized DUF497 family protein